MHRPNCLCIFFLVFSLKLVLHELYCFHRFGSVYIYSMRFSVKSVRHYMWNHVHQISLRCIRLRRPRSPVLSIFLHWFRLLGVLCIVPQRDKSFLPLLRLPLCQISLPHTWLTIEASSASSHQVIAVCSYPLLRYSSTLVGISLICL